MWDKSYVGSSVITNFWLNATLFSSEERQRNQKPLRGILSPWGFDSKAAENLKYIEFTSILPPNGETSNTNLMNEEEKFWRASSTNINTSMLAAK